MMEFEAHSIQAFSSNRNDGGLTGFFTPTENIMNTVVLFKNSSKIECVLYVHDDGLLNITELASKKAEPGCTEDTRQTRPCESRKNMRMTRDAFPEAWNYCKE